MPNTNGNNIRSMSDKELAMELDWIVQDAYLCGSGRDGMKLYPFEDYDSTLSEAEKICENFISQGYITNKSY